MNPANLTATRPRAAYHHGDLPNALRASAVEVIRSAGLHGFSLREVARRAGVSHAAPGYHFGDVRGCSPPSRRGFRDPPRRARALGRRHRRSVARLTRDRSRLRPGRHRHPAHCEVMFRDDVIDADDARLAEAGLAAYGVLEATVAAIADDTTRPCRSTTPHACVGALCRASSSSTPSSPCSTLCAAERRPARRARRALHRVDGQRPAAQRSPERS